MAVCGPVRHQNASLIARKRQLLSVPRELQCSMGGSYILKRGQMRWGWEKWRGNDGERDGRGFCCYSQTYTLYHLCSRGNLHIIIMTSHSVTYSLMRFIFRKPILVIILTAFLLLQSIVHIACTF
jgi:hypothetical protein